jgi:hypothetical protein
VGGLIHHLLINEKSNNVFRKRYEDLWDWNLTSQRVQLFVFDYYTSKKVTHYWMSPQIAGIISQKWNPLSPNIRNQHPLTYHPLALSDKLFEGLMIPAIFLSLLCYNQERSEDTYQRMTAFEKWIIKTITDFSFLSKDKDYFTTVFQDWEQSVGYKINPKLLNEEPIQLKDVVNIKTGEVWNPWKSRLYGKLDLFGTDFTKSSNDQDIINDNQDNHE